MYPAGGVSTASLGSMANSGMAPAHASSDEGKCYQVIAESLNKIAEVVALARVAFSPEMAQQRQRRSRFKLSVDELVEVRTALASWSVDPHAPLHIDVAWQGPQGEPVLLERWRVTFSTPQARHALASDASARRLKLREVCVRIAFLLRSLYSVARILPAWGLFRASRLGQSSTAVALYDPSAPAVGTSLGPALMERPVTAPPLEFPPDAPITSQGFPAVDTAFGDLSLGVEFRSDAAALARAAAVSFAPAQSMHLSQAIIQDYDPAPSSAGEEAPEPPPVVRKKPKSALSAELHRMGVGQESGLVRAEAAVAEQQAALAREQRALELAAQELELKRREQEERDRLAGGRRIPRHPGQAQAQASHAGSLPVAIPGQALQQQQQQQQRAQQRQPPPAQSTPPPQQLPLTRQHSKSLDSSQNPLLLPAVQAAPYGYRNMPSDDASLSLSRSGGRSKGGVDWARERASSQLSAFSFSPPPPGMPSSSFTDSSPPFASEAASSLLSSSPFVLGQHFGSPPFPPPAVTQLSSSPQPTLLLEGPAPARAPSAAVPVPVPAPAQGQAVPSPWNRPWGAASGRRGSASGMSELGGCFAMDDDVLEDSEGGGAFAFGLGSVGSDDEDPPAPAASGSAGPADVPDGEAMLSLLRAAPVQLELQEQRTVDSFAGDLERFRQLRDALQ